MTEIEILQRLLDQHRIELRKREKVLIALLGKDFIRFVNNPDLLNDRS